MNYLYVNVFVLAAMNFLVGVGWCALFNGGYESV